MNPNAFRLLAIFLCGGLGSCLRYLTGYGVTKLAGSAFPYATVTVNIAGSFLIAVFIAMSAGDKAVIGPELRLALTTGVMGGFTTYSAFNAETLAAFQQGHNTVGILNVLVTVTACLIAGWGGLAVGRWLSP